MHKIFPINFDIRTWPIFLTLPRITKSIDGIQLMRLFARRWIARSRQLLSSFDDLEREARRDIPCIPSNRCETQSFDLTEQKIRYSLDCAQQIHVDENESTREFSLARTRGWKTILTTTGDRISTAVTGGINGARFYVRTWTGIGTHPVALSGSSK